jgi:hypothetical protein
VTFDEWIAKYPTRLERIEKELMRRAWIAAQSAQPEGRTLEQMNQARNDSIDAARYRMLKSFALPRYVVKTTSGESASLYREHQITVDAMSWDNMDAVLDGSHPMNVGESKS